MISEKIGISTTRVSEATVVGWGSEPEPYLIVVADGPPGVTDKLHIPVASVQSLTDWPPRTKVRFTTILEVLP